MAVLKREYSISTYQSRQLNALLEINKKMTDMSRNVATGYGSFATPLAKFHTDLRSWLAPTITATGKVLAMSVGKMLSANKESLEAFDDISKIWVGATRSLEESLQYTASSIDKSTRTTSRMERRRQEEESKSRKRDDALMRIGSQIGNLIGRLSYILDGISDSLNDITVLTGESRSVVRSFQQGLSDTVTALNQQTGDKFSTTESIQKMVTIMNAADIRNTETLGGISRSMLISSRALDVNLGSMSRFLGRMYEVYNFSSRDQQGLLEGILQATQGSNVSQESIMASLNDPTFWMISDQMALARSKRYGISVQGALGDINAEYATVLTKIADERLDASGSGWYTNLLTGLMTGKDLEARKTLGYLNINADAMYDMILSEEGGLLKATQIIVNQLAELDSRTKGTYQGKILESHYGLPMEVVYAAGKFLDDSGATTFMEEYQGNLEKGTDILKNIEEQSIPFSEKLLKKFDSVLNTVSQGFDTVGIRLSDIVAGVSLFSRFSGGGSPLTSLLTVIGIGKAMTAGATTAATVGGGLLSTLGAKLSAAFPGISSAVGGVMTSVLPALSSIAPVAPVIADSLSQVPNQIRSANRNMWIELTAKSMMNNFPLIAHKWGLTERSNILGQRYINWTKDGQEVGLSQAWSPLHDLYEVYEKYGTNSKEYTAVWNALTGYDQKTHGDYSAWKRKNVPAYRTGINYVSSDRLAILHKGEAVVPERFNPAAHETELSRLRKGEQADIIASNEEVVAVLRDIKDFMSYWKLDSDTKNSAQTIKDKMAQKVALLSSQMSQGVL